MLHRVASHISKMQTGVPGWLSRLSVQLLISAQVTIPGLGDRAIHGVPLWVWSTLGILSFALCPSLPLPLSLAYRCSISQKKKVQNIHHCHAQNLPTVSHPWKIKPKLLSILPKCENSTLSYIQFFLSYKVFTIIKSTYLKQKYWDITLKHISVFYVKWNFPERKIANTCHPQIR